MQETKVSLTAKIAAQLNQRWLATAVKFSVIAIAVIALYRQDLTQVFTGAITNEATYHILAIPFLFGYLIYRKRKMVSASLQTSQIGARGFQKYLSMLAGISLCAAAVFAYWYGSYSFTPIEYHMLTLPFLAAGLVLILFDVQTLKQLLFPIAFLFFLTPPPDEILYGFGSWLANLSASASNSLANVFGLHASLSTSNAGPVITILTANHTSLPFNVNVACSGIYSIIGFTIFAVFIAYITRGTVWNKVAILIMGIPLIMALNIIRVTAILGIAYNFGESLALTFFHDIGATVLMFIGVLILLTITDKAFKKPKPTPPCPTCNPVPTKPAQPFCLNCGKLLKLSRIKLNFGDIAKILGVILIVIMLLSIQAPIFALTKGPAEVMVQTPSGTKVSTTNSMLPSIQGYTLTYAYRDTAFEQASGDDAALAYVYTAANATVSSVWVSMQIAASVTSEHRWETCLINFPLAEGNTVTVNKLDLRDVQLQTNAPITARYFAFQYKNSNETQVVLYWYETAVFNTNSTASTAQTKSVMISLIMYLSSPQNVTAAENQLMIFAHDVNNYWQPIQTWSAVALALSYSGLYLSATATAILAVLILYAVFINRRDKKMLLTLYRKLPEQNQKVIVAVGNAQKHGNATVEGILTELQKLTNEAVDKDWLMGKLAEAENAGLITRTLANRNDVPSILWKSQVPKMNPI